MDVFFILCIMILVLTTLNIYFREKILMRKRMNEHKRRWTQIEMNEPKVMGVIL
jgi:hypothetical protein